MNTGRRFWASVFAGWLCILAAACSPMARAQGASNVYLPVIITHPPAWWQPSPGTSWQIQYSGALDLSLNVEVYNLDLFDISADTVSVLHAQGRKVMCYFSAGSWEDWRPDAGNFPESVLGNPLEGWPGERWLDIRQIDILEPILKARLDLARQKGCDGIDPDNVEGYQNDSGFPLTYADQITFNRWVATEAHARGLGVGLKNDLAQISDLLSAFDWALNEQCFEYTECDLLLPFIQAGKPVFGIEYQGSPQDFCPQANALNFDTLKKNLELDAWRIACR
jgi:hypothetical protein